MGDVFAGEDHWLDRARFDERDYERERRPRREARVEQTRLHRCRYCRSILELDPLTGQLNYDEHQECAPTESDVKAEQLELAGVR